MIGNELRFIDLFAGIGGIRTGLKQAAGTYGMNARCVFTSEIKPYAVKVLEENYDEHNIAGDITKISSDEIPEFDILCARFPCQAFSSAGKRQGFSDTRGTMFFEVERILREKKPQGFILENVEGLVSHDNGRTFKVITERLLDLGYKISYKILNSKYFGVPQERKRIYIVGTFTQSPCLENFVSERKTIGDILENGKPLADTPFIRNLLNHYEVSQLYGKSIKDKRGGNTNIHSWDLEIKGPVSIEQKNLLNSILKERRKKKWAEQIGIDWMDGMPLTRQQISTFFDNKDLSEMLDDLVRKGYLSFEYPKKKIKVNRYMGYFCNVKSSRRIKGKRIQYSSRKTKF